MLTTIDIEPTTACDLDCPFCFGPKIEKRSRHISIENWKEAVFQFRELGVRNVVISGGEPVLYRKLGELIKFAKECGLTVVLSTHGRHRERLLYLSEHCDWIALPIDSLSTETSRVLRTDDVSWRTILETARQLKAVNSRLRIKVGTVATALNLADITSILGVLEDNQDACDTWKVYQYTPRRKYASNRESLEVSDCKFAELGREIFDRRRSDLEIVLSSNRSRGDAYLFVYHNGDVNLVNVGPTLSDQLVGNISRFSEIRFDKVQQALGENHERNFRSTYW